MHIVHVSVQAGFLGIFSAEIGSPGLEREKKQQKRDNHNKSGWLVSMFDGCHFGEN